MTLALFLLCCPGNLPAAEEANPAADTITTRTAQVIGLWPADSATSPTQPVEEPVPSRGDKVLRITNVRHPQMLVYHAENTTGTGPVPAVLVCPGGGYKILALNIEGTEVAQWLNSLGITAVVLKYRVPQNRAGALEDAQRAMGLIRHHAGQWNIDRERVGILGFSAGAHLSARLSQHTGGRTYAPVDDADKEDCRPDFAVLLYPAYLADKAYRLSDDMNVTSGTAPTFLVQTQDDRNHVFSSLAYAQALHKAGVPTEFHLFPTGGHGYGLRPTPHAVSSWPRLCRTWLENAGVLAKRDAGNSRQESRR